MKVQHNLLGIFSTFSFSLPLTSLTKIHLGYICININMYSIHSLSY